ncbi:MAG TPA: XdhC family protein [Acidocella sp.]|nr:XdhC family protein [Acidocella sp.]
MSAGGAGCGWTMPASASGQHPALLDPWDGALTMGEGTVIALLMATEGPAYRNLGAALAISADGHCAGAITSGCIEADLVLQAPQVRASGQPKRLRYGAGSPFFDLRLPCGGAIEVMCFLLRDADVLGALARQRAARRPVSLRVSGQGRLSLAPYAPTGVVTDGLSLGFRPPLRHVILGAGPEALVFTRLVASLGHDHKLLSHDEMTLGAARAAGCRAEKLSRISDLPDVLVDADTAVTLFSHDHDYEPELLRYLLAGTAFYIGAQGSRGAQRTRLARLQKLGVPAAQMARLRGPIGLIPSARDAQTLAVSVLAEIMDVARRRETMGGCAAAEAVG